MCKDNLDNVVFGDQSNYSNDSGFFSRAKNTKEVTYTAFESSFWHARKLKNAVVNTFTVGMLLLFLAYFLTIQETSGSFVISVVTVVLLIIHTVVLLSYFLTKKEERMSVLSKNVLSIADESLTISRSHEQATQNNTDNLKILNSKVETIEYLTDTIIKDFDALIELPAYYTIAKKELTDFPSPILLRPPAQHHHLLAPRFYRQRTSVEQHQGCRQTLYQ